MIYYIFLAFLTLAIISTLSPSSFIFCEIRHRHNHHNLNHYHAHKYEQINKEHSNEIKFLEKGQINQIWDENNMIHSARQDGRWFKFPTLPPMPSWTFPTVPSILGYTMPTMPPVQGFTIPTMPPVPSFEIPDLNHAVSNLQDAMKFGKINGNWLLDEIIKIFKTIVRGLRLHQIDFKRVQIPIPETEIFISGCFNGLDTIKRSGDFTAEIGTRTEFKAGLELGHLNLHLELIESGRRRSFNITYEEIKVIAHIDIDFGKTPPKVSFSEFKISIGKMKGDFRTGIKFIDATLNAKYKVLDTIKKPLLEVLSSGLKDKFNSASNKMMPTLAKLGWKKGVDAIGSTFG